MSREAERKRLQRQGYKHWSIPVHPKTLTQALLAEGLITEAQMEDPAALRGAAGRFVMRHCKVGRILFDKEADASQIARTERPIAGPPLKIEHGPGEKWSKEDTERWESGEMTPLRFNYRSGYWGGIAGDPVGRRPGDCCATVLDEFPPDWADRGRSGDRDGRNRLRITGPNPSKSRAKKVKPIEQLNASALRKLEKPYADKLKVKDSSPHFASLGDGEAQYKLDRLGAEAAGVTRRKPKATDIHGLQDNKDDLESDYFESE